MNPNRLCPGCMKEVQQPDKTCPNCGYLDRAYQQTRNCRVLPPYTILAGRYMLGKTLGEGGFGITYLAMDLKQQETVAIKEYFPVGLAARDTMDGNSELSCVTGNEKRQYYKHGLENFAKEANNLMKFRSLPGVVSVKNFFYQNKTAYLVMEYIDGISLKQYLNKRNKPIAEKNVLNVMRPVICALAKIHRAGMIHRDISPENIMLARDGRVLLIDFGAARSITGVETQCLTIILKHGYAPIEQYQTKGRQGPWTDVYALCATMYSALSGLSPEEAVERMDHDRMVPLKHVRFAAPLPQISPKTSDIIEKGLSIQAQDRYQDAEELRKALFRETAAPISEKEKEIPPAAVLSQEPPLKSGGNYTANEKIFLVVFLVIGIATAFVLTAYLFGQLLALL
ncbi:MAG: serine/threonine-protein kinase [Eubacteriales bacterium]|nr:serine/threonine-protein kinase [Eubacteriales bacterium]